MTKHNHVNVVVPVSPTLGSGRCGSCNALLEAGKKNTQRILFEVLQ